eukprot:8072832-Pyramimonas_sp.AAC.1
MVWSVYRSPYCTAARAPDPILDILSLCRHSGPERLPGRVQGFQQPSLGCPSYKGIEKAILGGRPAKRRVRWRCSHSFMGVFKSIELRTPSSSFTRKNARSCCSEKASSSWESVKNC